MLDTYPQHLNVLLVLCGLLLRERKSHYFYFIPYGTKFLLMMMSEIFIAVLVVWIFFFPQSLSILFSSRYVINERAFSFFK